MVLEQALALRVEDWALQVQEQVLRAPGSVRARLLAAQQWPQVLLRHCVLIQRLRPAQLTAN